MSSVAVNPPKTPVTEGSSGTAPATVPNVCKMPGPPAPFVPTPLPNVGKSGDSLKGGSKNVKFEGNKVAIKGSSFKSMGDIASKGTGGGIVSAQTHGKTEWVAPGSMDVKVEGKNVQLLGDAMTNNGGSPANAATSGELQGPAVLENFQKALCQIIKRCDASVNEEVLGPGKTPTREWCNKKVPGTDPPKTNAMVMGTKKDECAKKEINRRKAASSTELSKKVSTPDFDNQIPVPGGGTCMPDVIVGTPPKCDAVYDFKVPCPPTNQARWANYGAGARRPPNPAYEGKTQADIYRDACGVEPKLLSPNGPECNS